MGTNVRMDKTEVKKVNLIYPDLSYQIIGILFHVYNTLGYGLQERAYQKAIAIALKESGLIFHGRSTRP